MYRFKKSDYTLSLISGAVLTLCLWNGPILTFDAHLYVKGSQYLEQFGFHHLFSSGVFRAKPPIYPALLFFIGSNTAIAAWSNVLFHMLSLGLSFFLIDQLVQEKSLRLVTKGLISFGVPIILIHNFLLPDPAFLFIWNVHLVLVYLILKKASVKLFILLILSSLLMLGLRHIGIILVMPSALFMVYHFRNSQYKAALVLNLLLPLSAFFIWQFFLFKEAGTLSRLDHFNGLDLPDNFSQVLLHFNRWFIPATGITLLDLVAAVTTVAGLVYLAGIHISTSQSKGFSHFSIFIVLAFAVFIVLKGDLLLSDIERYLSLIYLPVLLLCIPGLQKIKDRIGSKVFNTLFIGWLIYPVGRLTHNVMLWAGL